jgi:hypothetical protein
VFEHQLIITLAGPEDAAALRYLADVDSQPYVEGDALLAISRGEPVAAISLASGVVAADPFRRTAATVELLRLRRSQLTAPTRRSRPTPSFLRRLAGRHVAQAT